MIKVVLDTNIVISALIKADSDPALILALIFEGQIRLCLTEDIFIEYEGVLSREKFQRLDQDSVKKALSGLKKMSRWAVPSTPVDVLKIDPDDNKFLQCASEAKADYLITGNKKHFPMAHYGVTKILSPRDFIYLVVKEIFD